MTLSDTDIFKGNVHRAVNHMGRIEQCSLEEILTWTESDHPIERSFGMAALNSCLSLDGLPFFEGNALALTEQLSPGKRVVVVGHFPHLEAIRQVATSLTILEKRPQEGDRPAEEAPQVVPQADILVMTGVTCLNDTIEELLALKRKEAICIVLGPTVPLSPVLFEAGVDVIGGAWIENPEIALPMLAQGATARFLRGIRQVLLPKHPDLLKHLPSISAPFP